ncbi:MAG: UDP-N-acetylmuramoyl-L-alanyl-D-glutamate--2,6-diaminopimelate ligase [Candidatus Dasytiphilus stammeri]
MKINNLNDLLAPWITFSLQQNIIIKDIKLDSRLLEAGDLFIAINGYKNDGRSFILQAINLGVNAVLAETYDGKYKNGYIQYIYEVPIIHLFNLSYILSELAARFYGYPGSKLSIVGVTGTNGKTTTTQILAQFIYLLGDKSAVMGTLGYGLYGDKLIYGNNTTPSAIDIQFFLKKFVEKKTKLVAIEISSHAIVQHRISAVPFSALVFTNLTRDHIDFHGNMDRYKKAKWSLFSYFNHKKSIINIDDDVGKNWLKDLPCSLAVAIQNTYDVNRIRRPWLFANKINYYQNGVKITIKSSWGEGECYSRLIGRFNVSNLLLAMATLLTLGYPLDLLLITSEKIKCICGRMEVFNTKDKTVIIDYAHTPDALEQSLKAARIHCHGSLWCVFGCGGNRDRGKRPIMGKIAKNLADKIIITTDNPRYEKPMDIIHDIINEIDITKSVYIIEDREIAITQAIMEAKLDDVVVIAGKGHETYQLVGNNISYFSDRAIVANLLKL